MGDEKQKPLAAEQIKAYVEAHLHEQIMASDIAKATGSRKSCMSLLVSDCRKICARIEQEFTSMASKSLLVIWVKCQRGLM